MDSTGIWLHSHGCPNNVQKCSKLKKPPVPSSVIPKKLCGFVFRRNNDNRVYRSESFRFIHKNDVFLPIGRASARSLGVSHPGFSIYFDLAGGYAITHYYWSRFILKWSCSANDRAYALEDENVLSFFLHIAIRMAVFMSAMKYY